MKLTKEAVDQFKEIFHKEFGTLLSDEEARERANSFMRLVLVAVRRQPWDKDDTPDSEQCKPRPGGFTEPDLTDDDWPVS
jgi:hypothetical protein